MREILEFGDDLSGAAQRLQRKEIRELEEKLEFADWYITAVSICWLATTAALIYTLQFVP